MSLLTIPIDILKSIMYFLNNKDNTNLIRVCKYFCIYGKERGYMTFINADLNTNIMTFVHRFCQHSHTVKSISIRGIDNPHIWLPHYVEKLNFEHCAITKYVNPCPRSNSRVVTSFKLSDYHRYKYKTTLRVNWSCFPNLEELELYVHDVDLTGIEQCKKLKKRKIDISNHI